MSLSELMPTLRELSRGDKVRVVEALVRDLAGEENPSNATNPKPEDSFWVGLSKEDTRIERQLIQQSVDAAREGRVSELNDAVSRIRAKHPVPQPKVGV